MELNSHKKLRKLPHVFGKVLELPFRSDADVAVEEGPDFLGFVVKTKAGGGVRAHAVEIHPGVIKIVVRNDHKLGCGVELFLDKLELDTWRFRLPSSALPELATAAFVDGKLVVTVPKGGDKRLLPHAYTFPFLPQNFNRYKMSDPISSDEDASLVNSIVYENDQVVEDEELLWNIDSVKHHHNHHDGHGHHHAPPPHSLDGAKTIDYHAHPPC